MTRFTTAHMLSFFKTHIISLLSIAVLLLFLKSVWATLGSDAYLIDGNIHDFFLPWNAAWAQAQGVEIHEDFHSPFGIIYFLLSSFSVHLTNAFPNALSLVDIHYLSSIIFGTFLTVLYFLSRATMPEGKRVPVWIWVIALILCFQARDYDRQGDFIPDWYGVYNSHLWSLILLQVAIVLHWTELRQTRLRTVVLAGFQSICLMVTFHYKASFFASSAIICILPVFYLGSLPKIGTYIGVGVALCSATLGFIALGGYSYAGYFNDLLLAAAAKSDQDSKSFNRLAEVFFGFVILAQALRNHHRPELRNDIGLLRQLGSYLLDTFFRKVRFKDLAFDAMLGFGLGLAVFGEYRQSILPVIIVLAFYVFSGYLGGALRQPQRWSILHAVILIYIFKFTDTSLEISRELAENSTNENRKYSDTDIWETGRIGKDGIAFRYAIFSTFFDYLDPLPFEQNSNGEHYLLDRAKSVHGSFPLADLQTGDGHWKQDLIDYSLSVFDPELSDTKALRQKAALLGPGIGSTQHYVRNLNATLNWLEETGISARTDLKIGHVGFANPWPFLTKTHFPDNSLHWNHLKTTLPSDNLTLLLEPMATADLVVMPLLSINTSMQWHFNCAFTLWNQEQGELFRPIEVVDTYLILVRENGSLANMESKGQPLQLKARSEPSFIQCNL